MDWTPRHVDFFVPPIPATGDTGGAEQGDVFPDNDVEQGPIVTGPTADFEEGPVTPEPNDELQEGSVTPTLFDSSASYPFFLASNATPQHHASDNPVFLYDPSAYDNLTIDEVDAQFASLINAKLKEQSVAFQQRQQVGRSNTSTMSMMKRPSYPQNTLFATIPLTATPTVTPTLFLLRRITLHLAWAAATARETASSVTPTMSPPSSYPLK